MSNEAVGRGPERSRGALRIRGRVPDVDREGDEGRLGELEELRDEGDSEDGEAGEFILEEDEEEGGAPGI